MKRLLLIMACLPWIANLWANPITVDQARQKASRFLQGQVVRKARRAAPAAQQMKMAAKGRDDTYYIFNAGDNGGYVVVSGDDATEEILGYSNSGTINPDDMPCGMKWLLNSYSDQIKFLRDNGITREQNSSSHRQANGDDSEETTTFRVDEKRLTSYYQSYTIDKEKNIKTGNPYNICLPQGEDGRELLTGCVATAMAGLMYAYQWPKKTIADIPPYTHTLLSPYGHVPGISKGCMIDWSNIKQKYSPFIDKNDPSARAVATLLELAGYSVKTSYDYIGEGSGAWTKDVPSALINYFGYSDSAVFRERKDYPTKWCEMLRKELMENGPVVYCGYEGDGLLGVMWFEDSHAFLIEGFKGDKFYINFGWGAGSSDDTLFLIDLIDVRDHVYSWPYNQGAVFNVRPLRPEVEVTGLRFNNLNHTSPSLNVIGPRRAPEALSFNENKLSGSITFHNKGESKSWKLFFLQLRDVEAADTLNRVILKSLAPDETYTYNFSFNDLTIGHHYVLSSLDLFGDEFFSSTELLCVENPAFADAEDDSGPKKLTRFEYWFDDDFNTRRIATLTKSESVVRGDINTDDLNDGMHRLNYRVRRDDGSYSSISSTPFLKLTKEQQGHLDYWIDDDVDNVQSLEIQDTEEEQSLTLDLANCPSGYHKLSMKVATPGSVMGSVQTVGFLKLDQSDASRLEYWFDNDIANKQTLTGKHAYSSDDYIYTEQFDLSELSPGLHRLNFRPVSSVGHTKGSVLSCNVLKLSKSKATQLEYWFDDDVENKVLLDGQAVSDGFIIDNQLDLSGLSFGLHRLNFCATSSDGTNKSSLITCTVMKTGSGPVTKLQYWFDGDFSKRRTISSQAGDGLADIIFANDLNISGISPGHHRLYYRGISDNGLTSTAVSSTPVLVKINYGNEGDAKMASHSLIIDNDSVVSSGSMSATKEAVLNYTLDTGNLKEGTHTLRSIFWNSYGACITDLTSFVVLPRDFLLGDVNRDGTVNVTDAVCILNYILGNTPSNFFFKAADINKDAIINITDVVGVMNIIMNGNRANSPKQEFDLLEIAP